MRTEIFRPQIICIFKQDSNLYLSYVAFAYSPLPVIPLIKMGIEPMQDQNADCSAIELLNTYYLSYLWFAPDGLKNRPGLLSLVVVVFLSDN